MRIEIEGKNFCIKFRYTGRDGQGITLAELYEEKGNDLTHTGYGGTAILHPKDRFEKKIGRKIALRRLFEDLEERSEFVLDREDRKKVWEKYFETHKK